MIFLTASLTASAMVMYMYNTAAAALLEGGGSGHEDASGEEAGEAAPAKNPAGQRGGLQESAIQRDQDPDTHSAAKVKEPTATDESKTGNVD
jgi:hypothetical protein